ncbi:hypothetical protein RB195_014517 [Necator americanus]|uniref:Uncharacterized protein n=1 Tax=Necator americanus TaxID=51031 RepID=A0ABR1E0H3_NECAM
MSAPLRAKPSKKNICFSVCTVFVVWYDLSRRDNCSGTVFKSEVQWDKCIEFQIGNAWNVARKPSATAGCTKNQIVVEHRASYRNTNWFVKFDDSHGLTRTNFAIYLGFGYPLHLIDDLLTSKKLPSILNGFLIFRITKMNPLLYFHLSSW